ncbi:hypothetical protein B0H12DRAFT_1085365 [Mycena haematopus]|nr:hypothetical protein B0H12DRAFT_1085365 [Mycena haematopus]
MDDSPPPAYSREYSRPLVDSRSLASAVASHNLDGTGTSRNVSKRAEGRDTFPRPLPRLPVGETSSLKTGTVSPLRLHKKSQSPPSLDGGPPTSNRRNPDTTPTPMSWEHGRKAVHTPPSFPNRGRESSLPQTETAPAVDPNAFYK